MKIDYKRIWREINEDSLTNPDQRIARKVPQQGFFSMFFATDFAQHLRFLYILVEPGSNISSSSLPTFRGLDVKVATITLGSHRNARFLVFAQAVPQTDNIFEAVISDICDRIGSLTDSGMFEETLTNILAEWKLFFDKGSEEILSEAAQKGLFGELSFLKDYMFSRYSIAEAVSAWTGPERTNHDYQLPNGVAVEIKTTAGQQHRKFTVTSEKQLDETGLNALFVVLYSVFVHVNRPDLSLPVLISEIKSALHTDTITLLQFELKLARYGYNVESADQYSLGFSRAGLTILQISEGFPRLLRTDIPEAIGDLSYSVAISGCRDFILTEDEFQTRF
ncbi:PD-(D/E)XK motif protein [Spirosoma oryzae]|nr:PD-(D/E)XK motif protein [Spirosoma oryzae]